MRTARVLKIALTFAVALLFGLIALNNISEYDANFDFVRHVMSMDQIFSHHHARAVSASAVQHLTFWLIVTCETAISLMCLTGSYQMLKNRTAQAAVFDKSKRLAVTGLGLGFIFITLAFATIGWEWFLMWRVQEQWVSDFSNVMTRLMLVCGVALIFVGQPET